MSPVRPRTPSTSRSSVMVSRRPLTLQTLRHATPPGGSTMAIITTDGQPIRYTIRKGRRIVRRGKTTEPQKLLDEQRRINPDHTVTFNINEPNN